MILPAFLSAGSKNESDQVDVFGSGGSTSLNHSSKHSSQSNQTRKQGQPNSDSSVALNPFIILADEVIYVGGTSFQRQATYKEYKNKPSGRDLLARLYDFAQNIPGIQLNPYQPNVFTPNSGAISWSQTVSGEQSVFTTINVKKEEEDTLVSVKVETSPGVEFRKDVIPRIASRIFAVAKKVPGEEQND
jgi:hypothetical protein